ncbi:MFS transporter, partial [Alkalihalophilus pseudofirmus]|nr:MFS transporter [Alkalihalophilus pseudofirmus]
ALSGWLIKYYSWRSVFLINIPIGILSLLLVYLFLPGFDKKENTKIDYKGAILSPFAFPFLIYGVHIGSNKGWGTTQAMIFL